MIQLKLQQIFFNPKVVAVLKRIADKGTSFGAPTPLEVELAIKVKKAFPSMELMRMVRRMMATPQNTAK
jgi:glutamate-1-semialdehyde aminotransferase